MISAARGFPPQATLVDVLRRITLDPVFARQNRATHQKTDRQKRKKPRSGRIASRIGQKTT